VVFRRDLSGRIAAGLGVLALLAVGSFADGDAGSVLLGVLGTLAIGALVYFRRPASLTIDLTTTADGTDITVLGPSRDVKTVEGIAAAMARPSAAQTPSAGRGATGPLWRRSN